MHEFDWEDVKILDSERYLGKKLIFEILIINTPKNGLNLQSATDFLHHSYTQILNKFKQ